MPSLVIHFTAAVAPAVPAAPGCTPTACSRLLVARLWLIHPCSAEAGAERVAKVCVMRVVRLVASVTVTSQLRSQRWDLAHEDVAGKRPQLVGDVVVGDAVWEAARQQEACTSGSSLVADYAELLSCQAQHFQHATSCHQTVARHTQ